MYALDLCYNCVLNKLIRYNVEKYSLQVVVMFNTNLIFGV